MKGLFNRIQFILNGLHFLLPIDDYSGSIAMSSSINGLSRMMVTHLFIINSNNVSNYSHRTQWPLTSTAALTAGQFVEDS